MALESPRRVSFAKQCINAPFTFLAVPLGLAGAVCPDGSGQPLFLRFGRAGNGPSEHGKTERTATDKQRRNNGKLAVRAIFRGTEEKYFDIIVRMEAIEQTGKARWRFTCSHAKSSDGAAPTNL